jgi:cyclic dehypoxanthinyl futalosine synthase
LQGGLNNELNLDYYADLFSFFKKEYPDIKIHALSPTEIQFLSEQSGFSISEVLKTLVDAGLDTLPGGGAEILSSRLRKELSPRKATVEQWLEVMRQAHLHDITTTATMMFAHLETLDERIQHLLLLRDLQNEKPKNTKGFISFIPWTFAPNNTALERQYPLGFFKSSASDYIRLIAVSRILLYNIPNIQASLLTVGKDVAQLCLHAGANDLGSLLLEENVISEHSQQAYISKEKMMKLINESGFQAAERNQDFNFIL